jgi:uncharacterized membrane protein YeaQ/YmgE (transglycosylase-associated protein family)
MGVIAWIVLGLLARTLIPGRRSQGLITTCLLTSQGSTRSGRGLNVHVADVIVIAACVPGQAQPRRLGGTDAASGAAPRLPGRASYEIT